MKRISLLLVATIVLTSCGANSEKQATTKTEVVQADITEVLYFHSKQRCITCNAIEKLTKEVIDSLANEKVVMKVIDITKDEATADQYEVTWSSLLLDRGGKIENLTELGFGYAKNQPQVFKEKFVEALMKIAE